MQTDTLIDFLWGLEVQTGEIGSFGSNGCTPSNYGSNGCTPSNFGSNGCTPYNFGSNGCTPSDFGSNGWTSSNFGYNGCTPSSFGSNGWAPSNFGSKGFTRSNFDSNGCTPSNFGYNVCTPSNFGSNGCTPSNVDFNGSTPPNFGSNGCTPSNFGSNGCTLSNFGSDGCNPSIFGYNGCTPSNFGSNWCIPSNFASQSHSKYGVVCKSIFNFSISGDTQWCPVARDPKKLLSCSLSISAETIFKARRKNIKRKICNINFQYYSSLVLFLSKGKRYQRAKTLESPCQKVPGLKTSYLKVNRFTKNSKKFNPQTAILPNSCLTQNRLTGPQTLDVRFKVKNQRKI